MKKICNKCRNYSEKYQFCFVNAIKIGKNLVDYCKDYKDRKEGTYAKSKKYAKHSV